jgi:hypothetical protein
LLPGDEAGVGALTGKRANGKAGKEQAGQSRGDWRKGRLPEADGLGNEGELAGAARAGLREGEASRLSQRRAKSLAQNPVIQAKMALAGD